MVTYTETEGHIELYFDQVPGEKTRDLLKICGWRWFGKKRCWSNIKNAENIEFAKSLCKEMNPVEKKPSRLISLDRIQLDEHSIIVRSNSFFCNAHHELTDMAGQVEVSDSKGNIRICLFPIAYCRTCNLYFALEDTYSELKKRGCILCQVMTYRDYKEYGAYNLESSYWRKESPLKILGYNVGKTDDLSTRQRRIILERAMEKGILSRDQILSYLDFFVRTHKNAYDAISKWKADREYIASYNLFSNPKVAIHRFIVIDHSRQN